MQQCVRPALGMRQIFMQEAAAPEPEEPSDEAAEPVASPPPPPQNEGIDWTKYSITIGLGVTFASVKLADYLGIIDLK